MTGPAISYATVSMFADLTRLGSVRVAPTPGDDFIVRIGAPDDSTRLDIYLSRESLGVLRDAITTHLESSP